MSKERLGEIKEHFAYCMDEGLLFAEQEEKLLEELYEQAERVPELEKQIKIRDFAVENASKLTEQLVEENKRYREVIESALSELGSYNPEYANSMAEKILLESLEGEE